jgi:uncharacterized protein YndB with AHSA1/START domain
MVRQNSRSRPETLERPHAPELRTLAVVAREVSHGRTTVVFTRDFATGVDAVWAMLTDPDRLRTWAPYTADRDLSLVGRVVLRMFGEDDTPQTEIPGVVLVADSPHLLEHSWGPDVLAWKLTLVSSGTRLTLHHTLADESMASAVAAGWHLCFDVAASVLAGHPVAPVRGAAAMDRGWAELNERYATVLGVPPFVFS